MKNKLGLSCALLLILVSMSLALPSLAQGSAQARFVHVAPGVSSLDIYVNDTLAVGDLPFGEASAYFNVPAGDLHIVASIAGTTIAVYEQGEKLADGSAVTMIATAATAPLQSVSENLDALQFGEGRLSFVYAISNGPAIDIMSRDTGEILGENIQPGGVVGDYQLSAGVFEFSVVPGGNDISAAMLNLRLPLAAGNSILAIIYGSAGDPKALTTSGGYRSCGWHWAGALCTCHARGNACRSKHQWKPDHTVPHLRHAFRTYRPTGRHAPNRFKHRPGGNHFTTADCGCGTSADGNYHGFACESECFTLQRRPE